jgi:hypothetical protein
MQSPTHTQFAHVHGHSDDADLRARGAVPPNVHGDLGDGYDEADADAAGARAVGGADRGDVANFAANDDGVDDAGRGRMTDAEFTANRDRLGAEQRGAYNSVLAHVHAVQRWDTAANLRARDDASPGQAPPAARPAPLLAFVTGGAGTGKSFLIAMLNEMLLRAHRGFARPGGHSVALVAPTGVAAANIHGRTIHSLLRLQVEDVGGGSGARQMQYKSLKGSAASQVRTPCGCVPRTLSRTAPVPGHCALHPDPPRRVRTHAG